MSYLAIAYISVIYITVAVMMIIIILTVKGMVNEKIRYYFMFLYTVSIFKIRIKLIISINELLYSLLRLCNFIN